MGGALSSANDLFAFRVCKDSYERYQSFRIENEDYAEPEDLFLASLQETFSIAKKEFETPFVSCTSPAVILYKFQYILSEDEKKEYIEAFQEAVLSEEKIAKKKLISSAKANDYSNSFSGSAADTKNEAEAAKLMRGETEEEDVLHDNPYLRKPVMKNHREEMQLKASASWYKYMAATECYVYIHTLSREIASIRPVDYEEEIVEVINEEEEAKDPANGLRTCTTDDILAVVEEVQAAGQTPLLLDASEEQIMKTFYSYKGRLEDFSPLTIPFAKGGAKRGELMENARKTLVGSMKGGATFVCYLGGITDEHADFKKKLCKKDCFPLGVFTESGKGIMRPSSNPKYKLIYRDEDLEEGQAVVRDGFNVVVISSLDPYEYEAKLESTIPLGYMEPIYVSKP